MALNKQGNFTFNHADQQDDLYKVKSATEIKQAFDSRANELKTTLNALIDALTASTGAIEIGATVTGLSGNNVKSLIESLKTLVDNLQTQVSDTSSELDLKANLSDVYTKLQLFSKTELQSAVDGDSGADKIKATPIATSPDTVQGILEWLKNQMDSTVLGQIPDGAVTPEKLSFDVATQLELDAVKSSVSDGKTLVKNAITGKGGTVLDADGDGVPTHQELADGVNTIQTTINGTAVDADVLTGKTYYNTDAKVKRTGTMINRGAMTITPGTTNQVIPAGYHNGSGIVQGDTDLIAANILSGKNIFGVVGTVKAGDYKIGDNILRQNMTKILDNGLNLFNTAPYLTNVEGGFVYNGFIYLFVNQNYLVKYSDTGTFIWQKQLSASTGIFYRIDTRGWYIENGELFVLTGTGTTSRKRVVKFNFTTEVITELDNDIPLADSVERILGFYVDGTTVYCLSEYYGTGYSLYFSKNTLGSQTGETSYQKYSARNYSHTFTWANSAYGFRTRLFKMNGKYYVYFANGDNGNPLLYEVNVTTGAFSSVAGVPSDAVLVEVLPNNGGVILTNSTSGIATVYNSSFVSTGQTFKIPLPIETENYTPHYPNLVDFVFSTENAKFGVNVTINRSADYAYYAIPFSKTGRNTELAFLTTNGTKLHFIPTNDYDTADSTLKSCTINKETWQILA